MYNLTYFELTYAWFIDCWEVLVVFVLVFVLSSKSHWVVKVDKCVIFTTEMCSVHGSLMVETFGWCFGLFSLVVINCIELTNEQLCRWNVWCACPISNGDVLVVFWFVCVWSSKSHWVVKFDKWAFLPLKCVVCMTHQQWRCSVGVWICFRSVVEIALGCQIWQMSNIAAEMRSVYGPSAMEMFWWCFGLFAFGRRNHIEL